VRAVEEIVAVGTRAGETAAAARGQACRSRPADLADRLSDALETRVKVEIGRRKGKITVEFASLDDLDRIVKAMSATRARAGGLARGTCVAAPGTWPGRTGALFT